MTVTFEGSITHTVEDLRGKKAYSKKYTNNIIEQPKVKDATKIGRQRFVKIYKFAEYQNTKKEIKSLSDSENFSNNSKFISSAATKIIQDRFAISMLTDLDEQLNMI